MQNASVMQLHASTVVVGNSMESDDSDQSLLGALVNKINFFLLFEKYY